MKILISGFEPFNGLKENPSELLVSSLNNNKLDFNIVSTILPVSFETSFPQLKSIIDETQPDFIVCFGVATTRSKISIERIAINHMDSSIPDNDGLTPHNQKISPEGPDGLFSSLPIQNMFQACSQLGVECEVSYSAGTYVCNHLMYQVLNYGLHQNFKAGFVHIPPLPNTVDLVDGMPLGKTSLGVIEMLKSISSLNT